MSEDALPMSKAWQVAITFAFGGGVSYMLWPSLDNVSKGLIFVFAALAGVSIHNGTWTENARDLRRGQREDRRQVYREAVNYIGGGSDKRS
jgi:hypothetical protein